MADFGQNYTEYQLKKRGRLRQLAREIYLKSALRLLEGRTIDFGCGLGELLRKLPPGSVGLDVNSFTVEKCLAQGLNVRTYDPENDGYHLADFSPGMFESIVLSHVLEHLEAPEMILSLLLQTAKRLQLKRVLIITPGKKGFSFDSTHKTFIDSEYFKRNILTNVEGFKIVHQKYFPVNYKFLENFFTHFELQVVYDRIIY